MKEAFILFIGMIFYGIIGLSSIIFSNYDIQLNLNNNTIVDTTYFNTYILFFIFTMLIIDFVSDVKYKYDILIHHIITIISLSVIYFTQYCKQIVILKLTCEVTSAIYILYIILNKHMNCLNEYFKLILYIFYIILFSIFRLYLDCKILYYLSYFINISVSIYDKLIFCGGFIAIFGFFIVNIYWFILSIRKLLNMIYTQKNYNVYSDYI